MRETMPVTEQEDALAFDSSEELNRQDLGVLLDRAMSYLSQETRTMLTLHYLLELPQHEVAARLGLTESAIKARMFGNRKRNNSVVM